MMICQDQEPLIAQVCELYDRISRLDSLSPSKDVDTLFTKLVLTCMPPNPIDVSKLCGRIQSIRSHLIRLCGRAEGLLESHFSAILASNPEPLKSLHLFPYYTNYLKLSRLEHDILVPHLPAAAGPATKIAFVGSGPLPLTSIVLATAHLTSASFHNYDIDGEANAAAEALVASDPDLSRRMFFHTGDIMDVVGDELGSYDVVFLAALVGMDAEEKLRVVRHLSDHMAPGALLMLRSAHGARAFLYPVVDPRELRGFRVLSVYHPTDEVINSVVIARKLDGDGGGRGDDECYVARRAPAVESTKPMMVLPSKCCHEIQFEGFNPLNVHGNMVEDLAFEDKM